MTAFRRAAQAAFERLYGGQPGPTAGVQWLSMDVQLDGRREIVSFSLRGEELSLSCTCGQAQCAHGRAALALLSGASAADATEERLSEVWPAPVVAAPPADLRTVEHADQAAAADATALAEALQDLLVAVLRAGVGAGASAALDEALQRLVRAAPAPLPLGVSRWVGRLKRALGARDGDDAARLLAGAALLVDDLNAPPTDSAARQRVLSWLGALSQETEGVARLSDRTLFEIAREEVTGLERGGVERRYLVDLADGALYREERAPDAAASLGPCPRLVTVWLASVEQGAAPQRIRLLQYAVTPLIEADAWRKLASHATRDFGALLEAYRGAVRAFPGLCEPFALVAPAELSQAAQPALIDEAGRHLPLHHPENPAALRCIDKVAQGGTPLWLAGRLLDRGGVLAFAPLGIGTLTDGRYGYTQM